MREISGTSEKVFVLINTTEYNGDGQYSVKVLNESELEDVGFTDGVNEEVDLRGYAPNNRTWRVRQMDVNDVADTEYSGCILIRIA